MADGDLIHIVEKVVDDKRLGRHLWHDPQNRAYAVRGGTAKPLLPKRVPKSKLRTRPWHRRGCFDQADSNCTMETAIGLLYSSPFYAKLGSKGRLDGYDTEPERVDGYERSKDYDPFPGRGYHGTTSDAPYKLLRAEGIIAEWRWLFGVQDVRDWVGYRGPFGTGTWWYASMDEPRRRGDRWYAEVVESSGQRGGHEYECIFRDPETGDYEFVQSWGPSYGANGRFWIDGADFEEKLLLNAGDASTVVLAA